MAVDIFWPNHHRSYGAGPEVQTGNLGSADCHADMDGCRVLNMALLGFVE